MDTRLLQYYERELLHLRETGGEFAREFPKIAGRLGMETYACADPYVERLLEGFAFLAARIQLKIDAEFPRFTNHLLELLYPQYLAPTPSMAVVQVQPDLAEGNLAAGYTLPRGTVLTANLGASDQTACEFRTAHPVTLWPLEVAEAQYFAYAGEVGGIHFPCFGEIRAGLRLRLRVTAGLTAGELALERLPLYLRGADGLPQRLLEQCLAHAVGAVVLPVAAKARWHHTIEAAQIRPRGFDDEEALLPCGPRSFHGHRLLQEYFAFPERFLFVEVGGLGAALAGCEDSEFELVIFFDQLEVGLEQVIGADHIALFCTPAINLFPKRCDRIHLAPELHEYHVVPDRTRPLDYEVFQLQQVTGYGNGMEGGRAFQPFYAAHDLDEDEEGAYYQVRRARRLLSERQRQRGPRASYLGGETFLALVDVHEAPNAAITGELAQLAVTALCTNRDLVLSMPLGVGKTDFYIESGAPAQAVRCVAGPTEPAPSHAEGETAWRLVNHLAMNYLSLLDGGHDSQGGGAASLRELLRLHCRVGDAAALRQVEGLRGAAVTSIVRRLPAAGPAAFARGLQVTLSMEESAFEGAGVFLLGAVLEQFFARYASINSFVETVLRSTRRGQVMHWPARLGTCATL